MQNLIDSYSNPFADYNANGMDSRTILNYWCDPFNFIQFSGINESTIYKDINSIVFMGGRGSGKTMFLRYWSYHVQKLLALSIPNHENDKQLLNFIKSKGGLGFYLRIDGPVLRSFEGYNVKPEKWDFIFTHYFELIVARAYIEVIHDLVSLKALNAKIVNTKLVPKIAPILGSKLSKIKTIEDILNRIETLISEVTTYRGTIPLREVNFNPSKGFASQTLSFKLPALIQENVNELQNIKFIIFIDEYENFSVQQQRMINTLLKFTGSHLTFRIGMRSEGFRTFATSSTDDFIKEGREYSKVIFEDVLIKDSGYQNYLKGIAKKRLENMKIFKENQFTDISEILGKNENIEQEAIDLVKSDTKHFKFYEKELSNIKIDDISYKENPLLELLNILWVIRGNPPKITKKSMFDYLNKKTTVDSKKYKRDYIDKYKLSLMFLLASIYHENKKYYSFNTFCFLSSGIVGHFIELCRHSFNFAAFENPDALFNEGTISKDQQDKAARAVAITELQGIQRIEDHGNLLYKFTLNIGNIFSDYHKDPRLRYPETNQFSVDKLSLEGTYFSAFSSALKWSIIQQKPSIQQTSPGKHRKDIYTINRIFSPQFGISSRTRGGVCEEYKPEDIIELMTKDDVKPKKMQQKTAKKSTNQTDLFK